MKHFDRMVATVLLTVPALGALADQQPLPAIPLGYEDAPVAQERANASNDVAAEPAIQPAGAIAEDPAGAADLEWDDNPAANAIVAQAEPNIKRLLESELDFVAAICKPNDGQKAWMKTSGKKNLTWAARRYAKQASGDHGGQFVPIHRPKEDPMQLISEAADRVVQEVFPADILATYRQEATARSDFHAQTNAAFLVAKLDETFRLTDDQCEAIKTSIAEIWQRQWEYYVQIMQHNPGFFPPVENAVLKHLTTEQRKIWKSQTRHQLGFDWNVNQQNRLGVNIPAKNKWLD